VLNSRVKPHWAKFGQPLAKVLLHVVSRVGTQWRRQTTVRYAMSRSGKFRLGYAGRRVPSRESPNTVEMPTGPIGLQSYSYMRRHIAASAAMQLQRRAESATFAVDPTQPMSLLRLVIV
jgi:hypothetical protein